MPGGAAELVAEAQNYFSAGQYDKAEDDYQKILQHDENNGLVLANLATIEMEQGKLDDAEKHIQAASPKVRTTPITWRCWAASEIPPRQKYDEALDALSRAAKLDPQNPEIENYLGRHARPQGSARRRRKRRCARRCNSIPITARRTTIWR